MAIAQQDHPDVFVSYSRQDEGSARPLIDYLGRAGFTVWWDGMLEAGTIYTRTTEDALEQARAVLVLWSARSVDSHWVRDEAQSGRDSGRLVPVSLDGSLPPLGFRQFQSVDLSGWNGEPEASQIVNVRNALARLVDPDAAPLISHAATRSPSVIPKRNSRMGLIAAAVAVVTVSGLGAAYFSGLFGAREAEAKTLAIMPFENLAQNSDQDYFSTGLAEEMRQTLSQGSDLQVAAEASSDKAAEEGGDARAIASKLGVRYLLSGSVRRADDKVRVTVQLTDGQEGFDVWSQAYDRKLEDIFAVQSDIARHVADALKARLAARGAEDAARAGGTTNPAAYDAYLRGIATYDSAVGESSDRAAQAQFRAAIKADPNYGAAWAALSRVQTTIANSYPSDIPIRQQYDAAVTSAKKAVAVAPQLASGHAALGYVLMNGRLDVAGAREPYVTAYRLAPRNADILGAYATYMGRTGNFAEARKAYIQAIALDPLNATTQRQWAQILFAEGRLDEAKAAVEKGLALNPEMGVAQRVLGDIAYLKGDYRSALGRYEHEKSSLSRLTGLAIARRKLGDDAGAEAGMAELKQEFGDNGLYQQAQVLAQWGRKKEALDTLEQAFAAGDSGLTLLRDDPMLAPLKGDPRFTRLLQRLGFA